MLEEAELAEDFGDAPIKELPEESKARLTQQFHLPPKAKQIGINVYEYIKTIKEENKVVEKIF